MPTMITNVSDGPVTVPLQPIALLPRGKSCIYVNIDPATIVLMLGGADAIAGVLRLDYLASVPSDQGLCPVIIAINIPVTRDNLPVLNQITSDQLLLLRGAHFTLIGDAGEEDQELIVLRDATGAYVYRAIDTTPIA